MSVSEARRITNRAKTARNIPAEKESKYIQECLNILNGSDHYLIPRNTNELPFNQEFRVLKFGNTQRSFGNENTVLILEGKDSKFGDEYDDEDFSIMLDYPFSQEPLLENLKKLMQLPSGYITVSLSHVKKSHSIDVLKFTFVREEEESKDETG